MNNKVTTKMEQRHKRSLQGLQYMIDLASETLSIGQMPDTNLANITLFYLSKFYKSLLALRLLAVSGFKEDSIVILRTLLESLLHLIYISLKPEERTRLWLEYYHVSQYRLLQRIDKHCQDIKDDITEEKRKEIENNYNRVKGNYRTKSRWCDKSLSDVVAELRKKDLQAEYWYNIVYSMDSSYVHSDISSSNDFFKEIEGIIYVADGPQIFEATEIISKATELTRRLLIQVYENWNLPVDKVKETWEKSKKLITDEFNNQNKGELKYSTKPKG